MSTEFDFPEDQNENEDPNVAQGRGKRHCAGVKIGKKGNSNAGLNPLGESNPAKDFSQLFQNIRNSQKELRKDAMTSFDDITTRQIPSAHPPQQYGTQLTALLRQETFAEPVKTTAAPRPAVKRPNNLEGLAELPLDNSLKSLLRFSSPEPFQCCQSSLTADSASVSAVMEDFCCGREPTGNSLEDKWRNGLMSWQYPQISLPSLPAAANMEKDTKRKDPWGGILEARRSSWQSAFRSLYYQLRNQKCSKFYLITAEEAKHPLVALFFAKEGGRRVEAIVSRSTRGIRSLLQEQSVGFSMPYAPSEAISKASEKHSRELQDLGQVTNASTTAKLDSSSQSLLFFQGARQVHGIFNWLMEFAVGQKSDAFDIPVLLAPTPFLGASLVKLPFKILPLAAQSEAGKDQLYRLEVQGIIPPWNFSKICSVLRTSQPSGFQVLMDSEPLSNNLNIFRSSAKEPNFRDITSENTGSILESMHGSYLRELRYVGAAYAARIIPA